jgi:hypothetical protein
MNIENLTTLRNFLAELPGEKFDMTEWKCGTVACIGGWATTVFAAEVLPYESLTSRFVNRVLGLAEDQGYELYFGDGTSKEVTTAQACIVLDHLIATGEVDWSVALEEREEAPAASPS